MRCYLLIILDSALMHVCCAFMHLDNVILIHKVIAAFIDRLHAMSWELTIIHITAPQDSHARLYILHRIFMHVLDSLFTHIFECCVNAWIGCYIIAYIGCHIDAYIVCYMNAYIKNYIHAMFNVLTAMFMYIVYGIWMQVLDAIFVYLRTVTFT